MRILITISVGLVCLIVGLLVGVLFAPQLKATQAGVMVTSVAAKLPFSGAQGEDSPFESYDYPTIKWRAQQLADSPGGIAQLTTTFEPGAKPGDNGTMKYQLKLYKSVNKDAREVQVLDANGFKIFQFNASDFHDIPQAPNIVEARDGLTCSEDQYRKAHEYSLK